MAGDFIPRTDAGFDTFHILDNFLDDFIESGYHVGSSDSLSKIFS